MESAEVEGVRRFEYPKDLVHANRFFVELSREPDGHPYEGVRKVEVETGFGPPADGRGWRAASQ